MEDLNKNFDGFDFNLDGLEIDFRKMPETVESDRANTGSVANIDNELSSEMIEGLTELQQAIFGEDIFDKNK